MPETTFTTTAVSFVFGYVYRNTAAIIALAIHAPYRFLRLILVHHFNKPKTLTLFCFTIFNDPELFYRPKITKNGC